jgi:hypothetical protein
MSVINDPGRRAWGLLQGRHLLGIAFAFCIGWTLHRLTAPSDISATRTQIAADPAADQSTNEKPVKLDPAGTQGQSLTHRTKRPRTEVGVFFLIAAALVGLGWWLLPDTSPPHVVPGFSISARFSGIFGVDASSISYSETHPRDNAIDAQVLFLFSKTNAPANSELLINIQLPENVAYHSCEAIDNWSHVHCFADIYTGGIEADVTFLHRGIGTGVLFHLSGPGLGFVESSGQVAAELPLVSDGVSGPELVDYQIKDAFDYQWSGERPELTSSDVSWSELPRITMADQVTTIGVRGDVQSKNSDSIFTAGIIIGTAGAALIAALQAMFKWFSRE